MLTLYPPIKPFHEVELAVGGGNTLHLEQIGNPDGLPVIFLHGGPGEGSMLEHRQLFDPSIYHIIIFDQRGCGRSYPHANTANISTNTTENLLADIECIRNTLNLDKFVFFGDAWGSLLALRYAQENPERILGIILHAVFLGSQHDIDWFFKTGANGIFPDYWQSFLKPLSEAQQKNILTGFYEQLIGSDEVQSMAAAKAWALWEAQCNTLNPCEKIINHFIEPGVAHPMALLECHYFLNHCFLKPHQILKEMPKIEHIPGMIIHGRYDMVSLLENSYILRQHWKNAELTIVRDAGHSLFEPPTIDAVMRATEHFAKYLSHL